MQAAISRHLYLHAIVAYNMTGLFAMPGLTTFRYGWIEHDLGIDRVLETQAGH